MIKIKDSVSGFSHLIGAILSIVGTYFLLINARNTEEVVIDSNTGKTEFLPKNSIYYIDRLSKLNTA